MQGALIFIIAGVTGYGLGFPVYGQLVRWNVLDYPNSRSSHDRPTARGAGVAIIITILLVTLSLPEAWAARQALALLAAALVLAGVSLVDDTNRCRRSGAWVVTRQWQSPGWSRLDGRASPEKARLDSDGSISSADY